jgi:hypothetical protein
MRAAIHALKYGAVPGRGPAGALLVERGTALLPADAGGGPAFDGSSRAAAPARLAECLQPGRLPPLCGSGVKALLPQAPAVQHPAADGLDADAWRRNVAGAFAVRRPAEVAGRHMLVDDVLTTGPPSGRRRGRARARRGSARSSSRVADLEAGP